MPGSSSTSSRSSTTAACGRPPKRSTWPNRRCPRRSARSNATSAPTCSTASGAGWCSPRRARRWSSRPARWSAGSPPRGPAWSRWRGCEVGRVEMAAMPSQAVEPLAGMIRRSPTRTPACRSRPGGVHRDRSARPGPNGRHRAGPGRRGRADHRDRRPAHAARPPAVRADHRPDGPYKGTVVRREELAGQRLIVGQPGTGMRRLVDDIRAAGVELTAVVETEHREAILPLVLSGVGITVLADSWAPLARQAGAPVHDLEPAAAPAPQSGHTDGRADPAGHRVPGRRPRSIARADREGLSVGTQSRLGRGTRRAGAMGHGHSHRIALIPGDGIGQEVIPAARAVLDAVGARHGVDVRLRRVRLVLRALPHRGRHDAGRRPRPGRATTTRSSSARSASRGCPTTCPCGAC